MKFIHVALLGALALPAAAQDSLSTAGPSVNIHLTKASGATIDGSLTTGPYSLTSGSSSGWGFSLGYGIARWLSIFATVDAAGTQPTTSSGQVIASDMSLDQMDAGVRVQWPLFKGRVVPYGVLAYSARMLTGTATTQYFGNGSLSFWGGASTYGLGLGVYASPHVAFDFTYLKSNGTYARTELPAGFSYDTHASSSSGSRFLGGVTWQIGRVGADRPPPPSVDSMVIGDAVRIRVGSSFVEGSVIALHPDSVFLQRVQHDSVQQFEVPRECIASVERQLPPKSVTRGAVAGGFIGAIGGSLLGIVNRSSDSKAPSSVGQFVLVDMLGGAAIGAVIGGVLTHESDRWQPLHFTPVPGSLEAKEAACRSWHKPG